MAQLEAKFDERFFAELGRAADVDRLAPKLIDSALPILQRALQAVYSPLKIGSKLKLVNTKRAKNGGYIGTITFRGNTGHYYYKSTSKMTKKKGRYPLSWAGLAVFLEYGTASHGNFPPTPAHGYMSKAVSSSESEIRDKIQETFEKEMEELKL